MKIFQVQNSPSGFFETENMSGYIIFRKRARLIYIFYGSFSNFGTIEIAKTARDFFSKKVVVKVKSNREKAQNAYFSREAKIFMGKKILVRTPVRTTNPSPNK